MVNKNEIRIGNWFEHTSDWSTVNQIESVGMQFQFDDIHFFYIHESLLQYEHLNPIPLSDEILELMEFSNDHGNGSSEWRYEVCPEYDYMYDYISVWNFNDDNIFEFKFPDGKVDIKYVHELQNLVFSLTGHELTYIKP